MFDAQPTLHGGLLSLRPLRADDRAALFGVASDPKIWEQHPARDRHEPAVFERFFEEALGSGGALVAIDITDGRIVGSSRFHGYDEARGEVEIGWTFLARSHWGGTYNAEMKRLMLEHAFRYVHTVVLLVGAQNFRSQRAVEKIGGKRAGTRVNGAGESRLLFAITKDEWSARLRSPWRTS